jgi:hypothetical protein
MPEVRDFNAELKSIQASVKTLGAQRDRLNRDAGVEERRVQESIEKLKELGIEAPDKLSVAQLSKLRDAAQEELRVKIDLLKGKVEEGQALMAEYEAIGV